MWYCWLISLTFINIVKNYINRKELYFRSSYLRCFIECVTLTIHFPYLKSLKHVTSRISVVSLESRMRLYVCMYYLGIFSNRVACVPNVSAWSTCPWPNVQKACQLLIFTCQLANNHATCERRVNFSTIFQKNYTFLHT